MNNQIQKCLREKLLNQKPGTVRRLNKIGKHTKNTEVEKHVRHGQLTKERKGKEDVCLNTQKADNEMQAEHEGEANRHAGDKLDRMCGKT